MLVLATAPACDGPSGPDFPAVSRIRVSPSTLVLDPGDTVRLTATALDDAGRPISEADPDFISWSGDDAVATVDAAGLVTAVAFGAADVVAESWDGATASSEVAVSPVTSLSPDTGRWGAVVTVGGDDLPANSAVYFTGPDDALLPAFTKSAADGALEVWVPAGAVTGPLTLEWPTGEAVTRRSFQVTGASDVLAGGAVVPFPFRNPSLMADGEAPHELTFSVAEAGPFTLELTDRGPANANTTVRAWLFRTDVDPSVLVSFVMTREPAALNAILDRVTYSRASLPAGEYTVIVAPMDLGAPENTAVTRAFGLRLDASAQPDRPADAREPNDFPAEAPTLTLPAPEGGLGFETPFAMDHYAFELTDTTTVWVTTGVADSLVLTYLFPAGVTDILEAWENDAVLASAGDGGPLQTVEATLPPGAYTALVWDWAGRARGYSLGMDTVAPAFDPSGEAVVGEPAAASRPRTGGPSPAAAMLRAAVTLPTTVRPRPRPSGDGGAVERKQP